MVISVLPACVTAQARTDAQINVMPLSLSNVMLPEVHVYEPAAIVIVTGSVPEA
jgi:hypothetical protein